MRLTKDCLTTFTLKECFLQVFYLAVIFVCSDFVLAVIFFAGIFFGSDFFLRTVFLAGIFSQGFFCRDFVGRDIFGRDSVCQSLLRLSSLLSLSKMVKILSFLNSQIFKMLCSHLQFEMYQTFLTASSEAIAVLGVAVLLSCDFVYLKSICMTQCRFITSLISLCYNEALQDNSAYYQK